MQDTLTPPRLLLAAPAARPRASFVLAFAAAFGTLTLTLFWRTRLGLCWLAFTALWVTVSLVVARRKPTDLALALAGTSLVLACAFVARASDWAEYVAVPLGVLAMLALPLVTTRGVTFARAEGLLGAARDAALNAPAAVLTATELPGEALAGAGKERAKRLGLGVLIGAPLSLVLVALFAADDAFFRLLSRGAGHFGTASRFAFEALVLSAASLLGYLALTHARGATTAPMGSPLPYRRTTDLAAATPDPARAGVSSLTWGVVLAQLLFVFAVFDALHAKTLFAGHAFLQAAGTTTYAAHLHAGFWQLTLAVLLAVATVLGGHSLVRAGSPEPAGVWLRGLECALLSLTGVTLASCFQRLDVYEEAYGYTYERLGVTFLLAACGALVAATLAKACFPRWRGYLGALACAALALSAVAGTFDADTFVTRHNLERARARGHAVDWDYLATLSRDATPALSASNDAARVSWLKARWSEREPEGGGWRGRRGLLD